MWSVLFFSTGSGYALFWSTSRCHPNKGKKEAGTCALWEVSWSTKQLTIYFPLLQYVHYLFKKLTCEVRCPTVCMPQLSQQPHHLSFAHMANKVLPFGIPALGAKCSSFVAIRRARSSYRWRNLKVLVALQWETKNMTRKHWEWANEVKKERKLIMTNRPTTCGYFCIMYECIFEYMHQSIN